jgi:hypothetical protein
MARDLELLSLEAGKYKDEDGNVVNCDVVGITIARVGSPASVQGDPIPKNTDFYAQGESFNNSSRGIWGAMPDYCAATVYLRRVSGE